jgi:integrative and conjugative element protein (TIGR02256 family)
MSVIIFKNADYKFSVEFDEEILDNIHQECIKAKNNETGGILIGKYSEDRNNCIISSINGPPKGSKQGRCTFKRSAVDLNKILHDKWDLGFRYVGDWHFHPNSSPKPSIVDDMQMKKFANSKKLNCHEPILLIIGGNQDKGWELSAHVYTKDRKIRLVEEIY